MTSSLCSRRLWRGLCIAAVGGVAGCLLVVLALAWWLSSHYQPLLTQRLSTLLGAEVRVAGSALSFRRGLGVGLERLVVQNRSEAAPFFTAERVDVLLDLRALLRGQPPVSLYPLPAPPYPSGSRGRSGGCSAPGGSLAGTHAQQPGRARSVVATARRAPPGVTRQPAPL